MLASRFSTLLCASAALGAASAHAQDSDVFVVQLRLPARAISLDVFAGRSADGVAAPGSALAQMGIAAPNTDDLVPLSSIEGLSYEEAPGEGAIIITCAITCFQRQHLNLASHETPAQITSDSSSGGYLNYEAELQWIEGNGTRASGIVEGALFGRWGLITSSWLGQSGDNARLTRLETTWTIDRPEHGVRARFGDSVLIGATGAPVRFGGLQVGRYFGLTPSLITYPTPALTGEAESASTVELYVDGVLRARSTVEAGPFIIDHTPVVSGAGEAELVVTDVLGRQRTISRPFFVNTSMLRRGLSDWSAAIGVQRHDYGLESARYGDTLAAVRVRHGLTDALTLEAAVEATAGVTTFQGGLSGASTHFGQAHISHAANHDGSFTSAAWYQDGRVVSFGVQAERRDGEYIALGQTDSGSFRQAVAGNFALNLGDFGAMTLTAAQIEFDDEPNARTLTFSYAPDFADGAMSFRLIHTERDESELAAGVSFSFSLSGDVSAHASAEHDRRGMSYRMSAHRAAEPDRLGWRARAAIGAAERAEVAAIARGALGDAIAEAGVANGVSGVRVRHAGSVGWVEDTAFAGRRIDGGFALVDSGAPNVSVARNRLDAGETGADGRRLVTNLQPYRVNTISINADDLPLDRAPTVPLRHVSVAQGGGALVRFTDAEERISETRIIFADGGAPPRGAVLTRARDQRRFPIGSNGRIVIQGPQSGDVLALGDCFAAADDDALSLGHLVLHCGAEL